MEDAIDSVKRLGLTRPTGKVTAVNRTRPATRDHEEAEFDYEDKVDINPAEHLHNAPQHIDLSLAMIRALLAGELPLEAIEALESFAPIGDLANGTYNCDRVEEKGLDFVAWPVGETLTYALEFAAS